MKRLLLFVVLLVSVVGGVGAANAAYRISTIDKVTSTFAERPVYTRCEYRDDPGSPNSLGAWGYVRRPTGRQKFDHIDGDLCDAVLRINDTTIDPFMRALGVLAIVHEAYHLRRWGLAGDEAKVECQAIRHWKVGAALLGATPETIAALWPTALAAHYEETNIVSPWTGDRPYRDDDCDVPSLVP